MGVTEPGGCARAKRASFQPSWRVFLRSLGASLTHGSVVSTTGSMLASISVIRHPDDPANRFSLFLALASPLPVPP
jgi:hypothetical protein